MDKRDDVTSPLLESTELGEQGMDLFEPPTSFCKLAIRLEEILGEEDKTKVFDNTTETNIENKPENKKYKKAIEHTRRANNVSKLEPGIIMTEKMHHKDIGPKRYVELGQRVD
ncbi:hypothetical protein EIN_135840 [Entamoeba invadens IP1]|uniref:Uncharacterized protein n=1 Tax=Entamoeba invadens IP1 TaxID=370355 RepID=A0A0A1TXB9_ENTIV|nr:hypothetical protein EIN_135840 [Entamoeba invadens IP1]ELP85960.1 hypothetical protein EIN_135840 [Entamoeba invadens IP1]|eukprot:XP_004185306.1 hypothetical protein EIN_135840 [Entamoeba invadens IP1]